MQATDIDASPNSSPTSVIPATIMIIITVALHLPCLRAWTELAWQGLLEVTRPIRVRVRVRARVRVRNRNRVRARAEATWAAISLSPAAWALSCGSGR